MDGEMKTKRLCSGDRIGGVVFTDGGDGGDGRWKDLNPEILALIFIRIPADQLIRDIPFVCKAWLATVAGPYCWTEIDVEQWCRRCNSSDRIDTAVRKLVRRSKGTFRRLSAYKLGNAGFSFVANCGRCLKVLQIPMSDVTDKMVEKHAESLAKVTVLDISYCLKITCKGLEALGKHCKSLIHLRRNLPPPEWEHASEIEASKADNGEAMVIADTMHGLCHLELGYGRFSDSGLDAILTKCKALKHLDIQGCWSVKLESDLENKCEQLKVFKSPWDDDYDDELSSDNDGDGEEFFSSDSD
ncbi:hypothetical protein HHK36_009001 [Tetracentron sinense]|uniref:F-box protein FBW2 n=1 Tax=Tetracentron sinense TaxID=13715 RepID=A0A834ZHY6_TETSI|nr:hypothetical protein HHK36_009001 [Tetracentron sinense]